MRLRTEFSRFFRLSPSSSRLALSTERVRAALKNNSLTVFYQPVFRATDGKMSGVEVFLRWPTGEGQFGNPASVSVDKLAPDLAMALGHRLRTCISADLEIWRSSGFIPETVAFNVAASELVDPQVRSAIPHVLCAGGRPPRQFRLQIHGAHLSNPFSLPLVEAIKSFRDDGFVIVLDEFGCGRISERVLADAPIDYLKLHRSVIRKYAGKRERAGFLEGLVGLATRHGYKTIAEGIEERAQLAELLDLGCTEVQGWIFARPMDSLTMLRRALDEKPATAWPPSKTIAAVHLDRITSPLKDGR